MRPRVIIHSATSLDGRLDGFTPDVALYYQLAGTWEADAMLSGSGTMIAAEADLPLDDGQAPIELGLKPGPLLVVIDSKGQITRWRQWRNQPFWGEVLVLVSESTPEKYLDYLKSERIQFEVVGQDRVDLEAGLNLLSEKYGVRTVRIDSGGSLNGSLLRAGLVDEVSVLISPYLVGGLSPSSMFQAPDTGSPTDAMRLLLTHVEEMNDDIVWLRYEVQK